MGQAPLRQEELRKKALMRKYSALFNTLEGLPELFTNYSKTHVVMSDFQPRFFLKKLNHRILTDSQIQEINTAEAAILTGPLDKPRNAKLLPFNFPFFGRHRVIKASVRKERERERESAIS